MRVATLSIPDYVEHRGGTKEIGKPTAAAVVREYEAAARGSLMTAEARKTCSELKERIDVACARDDVERLAENSPRHCEEPLRRHNPVFLVERQHWIASLLFSPGT